MQPQQQEKLKNLIKTSAILNDTERSEWLTLLELMDDKQANELEKILTGASQEPSPAKPEPAQDARLHHPLLVEKKAPASQTIQSPVVPGLKIKPPAGLDFSHIMNFPQVQNRNTPSAKGDSIAEIAARAKSLGQPPQQKTKSGADFSSQLKSVLAEKELPPGHPEPQNELELPAPGAKAAAVPAESARKPVPPPIPKPKPSTPVQTAPSKLEAKFEKPLPVGIINRPDSRHVTIPSMSAKTPAAAAPAAKEKPEKAVNQPAGRQEFLDKDKAAAVSTIKLTAKKPGYEAKKEEIKLAFKELKDAASLDVKLIDRFDINSIASKLRSLMGRYGYHEVIFNVEHSPLYAAYINTGAKLLQQQLTFEELPEGEGGRYLDKEQFEHVADLLHLIQAG